MAVNRGVAPPDTSTDVGQMRVLLGDVNYGPLDPPMSGYGDYEMYSDLELESFLEQGESPEGAMFFIYMQMAGAAARESKVTKDFDLSLDLTKRAGDLRAIAMMWKDRADAATADIFEVFNTVVSGCCRCELSEGLSCGGRCGSYFF